MEDELRVVLCAAPDATEAERLAAWLVDQRLAACVNLLGARSVYRWQGAVERADEVLLVIKTGAARLAELEARLVEEHPYDVPEVVALGAEAVHAPYLAWVLAETR